MKVGNFGWVALVAVAGWCGCVPGSAEFTFKTSAINAALTGGVARAWVHQQFHRDLSNEFHSVLVNQSVLTNDVEVMRWVLKETGLDAGFGGECLGIFSSNAVVRMWIDTGTNRWPQLYVDARTEVMIGSTNLFGRLSAELFASEHRAAASLSLEADGVVRDGCRSWFTLPELMAMEYCMGLSHGVDIGEGRNPDFKKSGNRLEELSHAVGDVFEPTHMDDLSCVVEGDQDAPIYVEATHAIVKGEAVPVFRACVRRGERVEFAMEKGKEGPLGQVRFSLSPLEAPLAN